MAVASDTEAGTTTQQQVPREGMFLAAYEVSSGLAGGPTLHLELTVYTPEKTVNGYATITQAVAPPQPAWSARVHGSFTYLTVMPNTSHVLVTLTGYPVLHWPHHGGIGPVIPPNCEIRMVLDQTWGSGTATYWYVDESGKHEVGHAEVRRVPLPADGAAGAGGTDASGVLAELPQAVLMPETVTAFYVGEHLVIHATGHEDGVAGIHIEELPMRIFPPQFSVVGRRSPAIGVFPYATTGIFGVQGLTEVTFVGPLGEHETFPVR